MKSILKSAVRLLLCACLLLPPVVTDGQTAAADFILTPSALETALDPLIKDRMNTLHIPGAAVVVTRGESIYFSKGYGYATLEPLSPMDPAGTRIPIGSLTKSVTATAAMQLVETGRLDLRRDINTYLNTYQLQPYHNTPITLHDLLTHTSGLDQAVYGVYGRSEDTVPSAAMFLKRYSGLQPPIRPPGAKYEYSNVGLGLVGNLIEQTSGQTLSSFYKEHLFGPLKMPSATLDLPVGDPKLAKSYTYSRGSYEEVPYSHIALPGAGGLSVVPNEFANYLIAHLNRGQAGGQGILKPEPSLNAMHAKQYAANEQQDGLGYGFFRGRTSAGLLTLYHTGEIDGFVSELVLIPSERIGIFVAINGGSSGVELHDRIVDVLSNYMILPLQMSASGRSAGSGTSAGYEPAELAGDYQAGINPVHGWGKWLRFLGGFSSKVEAMDSSTLQVTGIFSGSEERQTKIFKPAGAGLYRDAAGPETLSFHKVNGKMTVNGSDNITLEKVSFWQKTWTLLSLYAAGSLIFVVTVLIWLARYGIRSLRRSAQPVSRLIGGIALLQTVFLMIHLTYGISQLTYGYPGWYAWGICSLPLLSAALAILLLWKSAVNRKSGGAVWKIAFSTFTLGFTAFLFYWNFLSIHYS
ncbi:serine hydrolase domain-containing protein [Paenibacillus mucilaginosus]|nr:serine hydrolase domain-containing protein [Paenibacillus mucilaginosus]MCG7216047.1 beta-lactamase family protein [Paenibacillus mucilaginosus]WDM24576.1 beta-lactamase family protein [Paenibacillus mucilaginosus]